jgi:hypothetical protein
MELCGLPLTRLTPTGTTAREDSTRLSRSNEASFRFRVRSFKFQVGPFARRAAASAIEH